MVTATGRFRLNMSEFIRLDEDAPATVLNVLQAVVMLSEKDVAEVQHLVSEGRLREMFPFRARVTDIPPDSEPRHMLKRASASPLSRAERRDLIHASMPPSAEAREPVLTIADLAPSPWHSED